MRIYHRVSIDKSRVKQFLRAGIDLDEYAVPTTVELSSVIVRLEEADPNWARFEPLVKRLGGNDIVETEFSPEELSASQQVRFLSRSFTGFPEPSGAFEYRQQTYDPSGFCGECGIGLKQVAPFRLSKEPSWGRRQTFQLHWVFDEVFVRAEIWKQVFDPFGIGCWPVQNRSGNELDSVVQLRFEEVVDLAMPADAPKQTCRKCRCTRYLPLDRGFWPRPIGATSPLFRSTQFFGDGGAADREMFVSHELYEAMAKAKLNCNYWACASQ